jgi:hypothetical protein
MKFGKHARYVVVNLIYGCIVNARIVNNFFGAEANATIKHRCDAPFIG